MMLATWLRRFQRSNGDVIFMRAALVVIFAAFGYASGLITRRRGWYR